MCKIKTESKYKLLLILAMLVTLIPIFVVSMYNRPCVDDYDYSIKTATAVGTYGFDIIKIISAAWETDVHFYNNWQGLYSSAFILSLVPSIFGEMFYGFGTIAIIIFMFITIYCFVSLMLRLFMKTSRINKLLLSIFLLFFIIQGMPSALEGLYWYNGAANYVPFAFLNFIIWAFILNAYFTDNKKSKHLFVVVAMLLSIIVSGGNHVTSFANILFLFTASLFFLKKKMLDPIPVLLVALVGFLVVLVAPGTSVRQEALSHQGNLVITIVQSLIMTVPFIGDWFNLSFVVFLLILTPFLINVVKKSPFHYRYPVVLIVAEFCFLAAMHSIPYYAMGNFGAARLTNVMWITFVFLSMVTYTYILGWVIQHHIIVVYLHDIKAWQKFLFTLVCIAVMAISNGTGYSNSVKAAEDIVTGKAQKFSIELDSRIEILKTSQEEIVYLKPIENTDCILFFADIGYDAEIWPNTSIGRYYEKKVVLNDENSLH